MMKYLIGIYEKAMPNTLSIAEKLQTAKEFGYDFVEISIDETDEKLSRLEWTDDEIAALREDVSRVGIGFGSMCLSGHRKYPLGSHDPAVRARSLEIFEKACRLCEKLGIRIIQLAGYDVYYEEKDSQTEKDFLKNLKYITSYAAARGILLGFETMETPFMDTVNKAMKYVRLVNSPYLGVYPDIGNLTNAARIYKDNVDTDLMSGEGHIVAAHIKETVEGHYRDIPFGTGETRYEEAIDALHSMGVNRFVTEFWYKEENGDYREVIRHAIGFVREKLDRVYER